MISERFDLRCPADGVYLHDYLLFRKTGQLRNSSAFLNRSARQADILSYEPVQASFAVSNDNRNPNISPIRVAGGGFNFRAALGNPSNVSTPANPAASPFSRDSGSPSASYTTAPSVPSSLAGGVSSPPSENTPQTPQYDTTDAALGGVLGALPPSANFSAPAPQRRDYVVVEYKQHNTPPYATFGSRMVQSMVVCKRLRGHNGCINSIEFNDDASLLITGSDDLKIKIYDTASWKNVASVSTQHAANIFSAIMLPFSRSVLVSCGLDGGICVSDIHSNTSNVVHRYRFVMATKLMPLPQWGSGHVAVCGFESGDIAFIDTRTKLIPHKAALIHSKGGTTQRIPINGIASHPHNPNIFAFASDIPHAQLCDIRYLANTSVEQCRPRCAFSEVGVITNRFRNRGIGGIGFSESGDRLLLNFKDSDLYGVEWTKIASAPDLSLMTNDAQAAFGGIQLRHWPDPYAQALQDSLQGMGAFGASESARADPSATTQATPDEPEDEESEEDLFLRSALALLGSTQSTGDREGDIMAQLADTISANRDHRLTGMTAAARRAEAQRFNPAPSPSPLGNGSGDDRRDNTIVCYKGRKNRVTMFKEATYLFDDQFVATGSDDGNVYIWESVTARLVNKIKCDRSIVNGVLHNPRIPLALIACGIDSDAKVVKPFGSYLASKVTIRRPLGPNAGIPVTYAAGSSSTSSPQSHRETIVDMLSSNLDIAIDGTPFPSTINGIASSAAGAEIRTLNNVRATSRRLRGFFGTNLDADPFVDDEESHIRPESDNDNARSGSDDDDDDDDDDEWVIENEEAEEEIESEQDDDDEDDIDSGENDSEGRPEDEENSDGLGVEELDEHDEELEYESDDEYMEDDPDLNEHEEYEADTTSDETSDEPDDPLPPPTGITDYYPQYYDEWPQIQYALYNAHLIDKYVLSHIVGDMAEMDSAEGTPSVQRDTTAAISFALDDRNDLVKWLPNVPTYRSFRHFGIQYRDHVIPFEQRLHDVCGGAANPTLRSMIRPNPSSVDAPLETLISQIDLSTARVPPSLFRNNFEHNLRYFDSICASMYDVMKSTSNMFSRNRAADHLNSNDPLPISSSNDDRNQNETGTDNSSNDHEYVRSLARNAKRRSQANAPAVPMSELSSPADCLGDTIPFHSLPDDSVHHPDSIARKLIWNCKTLLGEVIRLFAVLKFRDGKFVELCWEHVQYGSLAIQNRGAPGFERPSTISDRANFWPSQQYEVRKIKLIFDLLEVYLKPALRFPCCSPNRSAQLLFLFSLHIELKLYFSAMMAELHSVFGLLLQAKNLISKFEVPSLVRPLFDSEFASPRVGAPPFASEKTIAPQTNAFACDALFLRCLLLEPNHEGLPDFFDPASVQRSVRQHILRIQTFDSQSESNSRLAPQYITTNRIQVIQNILAPFVEQGALTDLFERPLL